MHVNERAYTGEPIARWLACSACKPGSGLVAGSTLGRGRPFPGVNMCTNSISPRASHSDETIHRGPRHRSVCVANCVAKSSRHPVHKVFGQLDSNPNIVYYNTASPRFGTLVLAKLRLSRCEIIFPNWILWKFRFFPLEIRGCNNLFFLGY